MGRAADRLGRTATQLRSLPEQGVRSAVATGKLAAVRALREDAGSDARLSGVRDGVAQTVEVKVANRGGGTYSEGRVKAGPQRQRAPWFWLDKGTKPGPRPPRSGRSRGGGNHPGTPAKHTWDRALAVTVPAVRKEFQRLFSKATGG